MSYDDPLEQLAKTANWIAFGKALSSALETPTRYGCRDRNQLLARVAQHRGVDASSLRNPLAAVAWMRLNAPNALDEEAPSVPMTGVLTLSQISDLSGEAARGLAPGFFSGAISRRELQEQLRALRAARGKKTFTPHDRIEGQIAFEEKVFKCLQQNPAALAVDPGVEIVRSEGAGLVPADFYVVEDGQTVAAIECKAHRNKRHHRYLLETLSMTALMAREHFRAILIVPDTWGDSIAELANLIDRLHLERVSVAVFADDNQIILYYPQPGT
jgi:hypothetical protein